ncbi:MAG TPA: o-succinylbenzoate synthase [Azonexus sp.]|nr:o-succinylbenzoate synthase [Azonexus sp.]
MKVVAADWLPYCLPLRRPWQTSRGTLNERHGRLRRLTTDDGRTGWGDCAPLPEFGIDQAAVTAFAEECATLDLAAQRAGLPLNAWLSGRAPLASVAVNASFGPISTVDRNSLAQAAAAGFTVAKLKVGVAPVADEIAALHWLAATLPPPLRLRLDANRAWPLAAARNFVAACAGLPIDGLEEPLADPDPARLASLQAAAAFPLAIDESTHLLDAAFFRHPPVRRLIIKPARHGGLLASTELALRARASGLEVVVTSALESACGIATLAHLAAAVAPDAVHGLATADWLASDTGPSPPVADGRLQLPKGNGFGFAMEGSVAAAIPIKAEQRMSAYSKVFSVFRRGE